MSEQSGDRRLKESVAVVYETDTFNSFLKDALHPGGLELTRRIAEINLLNKNSTVLDIACGKGGTPLLLAQEYKCNVIGIDLSDKMVALARNRTETERLNGRVNLVIADAEELPFTDATFDVILSECSFSILPNKEKAASEMKRVLKSGGRLVITDIILRGVIPPEARNKLKLACQVPLLPCMAGAMPIDDYIAILERAGFQNPYIEDHSMQLKKLGYQMAMSFGGWEGFLQQLSLELFSDSSSKGIEELASSVEVYRRLFTQGKPGYALIVVSKP